MKKAVWLGLGTVQSRNETSVSRSSHLLVSVNTTVARIPVIFKARPKYSDIIQKVSARAFH